MKGEDNIKTNVSKIALRINGERKWLRVVSYGDIRYKDTGLRLCNSAN